jgi:hypothetical protein
MYLAQKEFLYTKLRVAPENFRPTFEVDEETFWDMLGAVARSYRQAKTKMSIVGVARKDYQNELRTVLLYEVGQAVSQSRGNECQRRKLYSGLCSIAGQAGAREAYFALLNPRFPEFEEAVSAPSTS